MARLRSGILPLIRLKLLLRFFDGVNKGTSLWGQSFEKYATLILIKLNTDILKICNKLSEQAKDNSI
jgi:hypothetical protein